VVADCTLGDTPPATIPATLPATTPATPPATIPATIYHVTRANSYNVS